MKNPTPIQISITSSFIIALSITLFAAIFNAFTLIFNWLLLPVLFIVLLIVSYFINYYLLEKFIYRKIKLIYKSIFTAKMADQDHLFKVNMKKDIISEVESEVTKWAAKNKTEYEDLKVAEKYRREFLANVSHELKSPIFNIQGYLHTLLDGGIDDDSIKIKYLTKAAQNLDSLSAIVSDLEVISKLEAGELPLNLQTFDIYNLVKDSIESHELFAKDFKITLGFKPGINNLINVIADKEKIKQVLSNLILNSIKYGKENGKTLIGLYDMDENILIEVSDNGSGISQENLPRIFERFFRTDKSRSRKEGGSGLGLAIVKHIIEAHGQTVHVRSTIGVGSTFGFTLKKAQ